MRIAHRAVCAPILLYACLLLAACGGNAGHRRVRIASGGPGLQTWCMPVVLAEMISVAKAMHAVIGSTIDISGDWVKWSEGSPVQVLRPERKWEGADAPVVLSLRSTACSLAGDSGLGTGAQRRRGVSPD